MNTEIKNVVQRKYSAAARGVATSSCCGSNKDCITRGLYSGDQESALPETAVLASLGCGNPTALAQLHPGETVLDLGSGGGIDVLLSARRVGPTGKAFGLDMTDDMLALARENQQKAGATNVEFLKGEIENIPLPDNSVDVIISNCVINLSADKDRVLREAFRVLKPGGRFAVSDVVVRGEVPAEARRSMELWAGCIAGALEESDYRSKLAAAGFSAVDLEPTRVYTREDAVEFLAGTGFDPAEVDGKFASMFIRARKPTNQRIDIFESAACCATGECGPEPHPVIPRFNADIEWITARGVEVNRYSLTENTEAFTANNAVVEILATEGPGVLPLILVNGEVTHRGTYPLRHRLAAWTGLTDHEPTGLPILDNRPAEANCC